MNMGPPGLPDGEMGGVRDGESRLAARLGASATEKMESPLLNGDGIGELSEAGLQALLDARGGCPSVSLGLRAQG